jgi:hypothetical protein
VEDWEVLQEQEGIRTGELEESSILVESVGEGDLEMGEDDGWMEARRVA